jgi:tetratricopeptide (TPR) repeat protein
MTSRYLLLILMLSAPRLTWSAEDFVPLYEHGDYELAARLCRQELADPRTLPPERAEAHRYLAASLHAMGRVQEARKQLELLLREQPGAGMDIKRFLPELAEFADAIRKQLAIERAYAQAVEREQKILEELSRLRPPPMYMRPEALGLCEFLGPQWAVEAGLAFHRAQLEGSARVLLNRDSAISPATLYPTFQVQGGLLLGGGKLRPLLSLRSVLAPAVSGYAAGVGAGMRYALPSGFVALADVGADYFFLMGDSNHRRFAVTAQAGVGFDVPLPSGR